MTDRQPFDLRPEQLPVIVAGARTPFMESGGAYAALMSHQLGAKVIAGLVEKSGIDAGLVDLVVMGTVLHEVETSNVARECMLGAGLPSTTPAYTVSMAGLSPTVALTSVCDQIALGRIEAGIAGGTENFSDIPVRLGRGLRRGAFKLYQDRSAASLLRVLKTLRPGDLKPELPSGADYTTQKTMGVLCEAMIAKFGVARADADRFAAGSHAKAIAAWNVGSYDEDIITVTLAGGARIQRDDTPRADATTAKLGLLKPVFDRRRGSITAGTASRFSDGAAAILVTSQGAAERLKLQPQAIVRDYLFSGVADLETEMLCGPAMSIPPLLRRNGLAFDDVGVWELHEAFAAQILVNDACLRSPDFARGRLGLDQPPGGLPLEKLNAWGGSLALGNPFAATGARLLSTAARRLRHERQRYAVISSCAGGGLGAAVLLENPQAI